MTDLTTSVHDSITEVKQGEWNAIVAQQSRTGSVFERYEWLLAYERATGATGYHVQVRKNGTLVGVHPAFVRSLPGTPFRFLGPAMPGSNGALVATDEAAVLDAITGQAARATHGRTIGHLLKPASSRSLRYANRLQNRGYVPSVRDCQFELDIDREWEDIAADLDQKKRRNLRKADEMGVTATEVPVTDDNLRAFARKHETHMERIDGEGTSLSFLQALLSTVGDRIKLFSARVDGESAGELLAVLGHERDCLYLLFPAYDSEMFRYFPSEVLYRGAIQWGIDQGFTTCNYGDTNPDIDDGTYAFKADFGGKPVATIRWERIGSRVGRLLYLLGGERIVDRIRRPLSRVVGP